MNSSTGGTTIDGNNWGIFKEAVNAVLGKPTTAHNCYGDAPEQCAKLWQDQGGKATWDPVYKPQIDKSTNNTKPKKYNKVRFTHHFWQDIASGASYASYTSKTLTIGFGIIKEKENNQ